MGNAASDVTSGVKKQAEGSSCKLYELVDMKGGGILVELTKQASATKNYAALDEAIKTRVEPFLYNKGEGKKFHISKIILARNRERPKHKWLLKNEADFDNYQEPTDCKDPKMYRSVCWDLEERGNVGETGFLICLLQASSVHAELLKRMLMHYPRLIDDTYLGDDYYGENALHIAIVNEDTGMVKYLLDNGVNVMERCFGAFMSPEDQKPTRNDSLKHEYVICDPHTNYEGYVYWGEYPASFAACLGQEDCYRLILAKGADPDAQDSNGNTVLHMMAIHNKKHMFNVAYELGADLHIYNNLNLTPLRLAAKIARKDLFFHIINIAREIYWQIGSVTCAAYPLTEVDTINPTDGGIQKESALNSIVFGESTAHLDLLEGPIIDLLITKWNSFIKARFYKQFILFTLFFLMTMVAFTQRPLHNTTNQKLATSSSADPNLKNLTTKRISTATNIRKGLKTSAALKLLNTTSAGFEEETAATMGNDTENDAMLVDEFGIDGNETLLMVSYLEELQQIMNNDTNGDGNDTTIKRDTDTCGRTMDTTNDIVLSVLDLLMFLGSIAYLLGAAREWHFLGSSMFFENLATAPARVLFLISRILTLVMALLHVLCLQQLEDMVSIMVMLSTAPYFLFFCRGFKTVGPFVVMIYRMIVGDLLRFVTIYLIFIMGFSQAFFIIFLSYKPPEGKSNPMSTPAESVITMFLMSLQSFEQTFDAFKDTEHPYIAKILFIIYMAIAAILLINMLIAMMGNTYTKIAETKNEWQRQWARIVLVVERGVSPKERQARQRLYSQPMTDGRLALVLRLNQTPDEKEEMKDLLDIRRYHDRAIQKRQAKLQEEAENQQLQQYQTGGRRKSSGTLIGAARHSIVDTLMPLSMATANTGGTATGGALNNFGAERY